MMIPLSEMKISAEILRMASGPGVEALGTGESTPLRMYFPGGGGGVTSFLQQWCILSLYSPGCDDDFFFLTSFFKMKEGSC